MASSLPLIFASLTKSQKMQRKGALGPLFYCGIWLLSRARRSATATKICTDGKHVRQPRCSQIVCGTSSSDGSSACEKSHRRSRLRGRVPFELLSMSRATWCPPLGGLLGLAGAKLGPVAAGVTVGGRSTEAVFLASVAPNDRPLSKKRVRGATPIRWTLWR